MDYHVLTYTKTLILTD